MKRKIRIFCIFAALTLILSAAAPVLARASDNMIESGKLNIVIDGGTEKTEVKAGEETEIKIKLVNNTTISSLKAKVFWPAELELISAEYDIYNSKDNSAMVNEPIPDDKEDPDWSTVKEHYVFNWLTAFREVTGDTTYVTLKFKVKDDAKAGDFLAITAEIDPENVFNKDGDNIDFKLINGGIYVLGSDNETEPAKTDAPATSEQGQQGQQGQQSGGGNNSVVWIIIAAAVAVICAAVAAVLIIKRKKRAK